jgi:hypothetical protein
MAQPGRLPIPSSISQVTPPPGARRRLSAYTGLSLVLFVYAIYLVFYSGVFHSSDAQFIVAATESLVKRGEFTASQLWWHRDAIETIASDGEPYSKYGIGASLMAVPLYVLALSWPRLGMVQAVMLTNLLVTAVSAWLVLKFVSALGYSTGIALGTSLLFALGTSAMVYAHYYFTEPLSGLTLVGSILGLYVYRARKQERYAWLAGVTMSLAVATKLINILFLVPVLAYAVGSLWPEVCASRRVRNKEALVNVWRMKSRWLPVGLPLVLTLALLGVFNALRWGSPFASGYPAWERFTHPLLAGVWGLLFSSEKGLFVYNPILIVSLLALPLFWRRHRSEALVILAVAALHILVYARWHDWRGGVAWGPRFLVPLLPLLILPLAPLLTEVWQPNHSLQASEPRRSGRKSWSLLPIRGAGRWVVSVTLLLISGVSIAVQIVGSGVSFLRYGDHFSELARPISPALYGIGSKWPILGHALLFQPENWDVAWVQVSANRVTIDWVVLTMLAGLVILAGLGLAVQYWRRAGLYQLLMIGLAAFVSLTLLLRSADDNRFGGGEDYLELLKTLAMVSDADDLVLLDNHIYTNFFFNYNRSLSRWYALDQQANMPDRTVHLLTRSVQQYASIWLVTDRSPDFASDRLVEAWLSQHAYKVNETVFSPYARLVQYDSRTVPEAARRVLNVRLGRNVELMAFDLSFLDRSEPVRLTLYWQALQSISQDYTVFVHLIDSSGHLAWQVDRYPVDGFRPTTSWEVGDIVVDRYAWRLPLELPPGEYRLITGLYDWQTGQRLPASGSQATPLGDSVVLASLSVPPPADD